MSITVTTSNPNALIEAIYKAIEDEKIDTWACSEEGYFTHVTSSGQWAEKAWLKYRTMENRLIFNIFPGTQNPITRPVYAIYHGRFIEMLISHFSTLFTQVSATSNPTKMDKAQRA